jgi:predicted nucleic acid-binding protein
MAFKNSRDLHHSAAVSLWDLSYEINVIWTPWHRVEVFNAIRQAERWRLLSASAVVIRTLEKEVRLGYWPHVEFSWTETVRTANELSAVHCRDLTIRAMDLFHVAIACVVGADQFLTFDDDQASLAEAVGVAVWKGTR